MERAIWSVADSFTEVTQNPASNASLNATIALLRTNFVNQNRGQQLISLDVRLIIGLVVSIAGSIANTVVLTVLTLARREFGSNVNTLIINQSAMDLLACLSVIGVYVVMLTHGFVYRGNQIVDGIICVVFNSGVFAAIGMTAGKIGLVVITLERYFMIVHAVAHRKYYRDWMTKVGVALPWIGAMCLTLFPAIGTTRIVNGRCLKMGVWPNDGMAKAYAVVRFLFHYAIPVGCFVYCYGRIFQTIRRQSKVVGVGAGRSQSISMATMTRDRNMGQVQQLQATGATTGGKLSRTEMNVLQTMIAVIVCFMICFTVSAIENLLQPFGISIMPRKIFVLFTLLSFINPSVNPVIYAARYGVFKRFLKQKWNKISPSNATQSAINALG